MHLELLVHASPDKHKEIYKKINEFRYPVEGKLRKGVHKPFISEWRVYDIRVLEEVAPRLLRDLNVKLTKKDTRFILNKEKQSQGAKIIYNLARLFRFFLGFKNIKKAEGEKEFQIHPWHNCILLGAKPDPKKSNMFGNDKGEVL